MRERAEWQGFCWGVIFPLLIVFVLIFVGLLFWFCCGVVSVRSFGGIYLIYGGYGYDHSLYVLYLLSKSKAVTNETETNINA